MNHAALGARGDATSKLYTSFATEEFATVVLVHVAKVVQTFEDAALGV